MARYWHVEESVVVLSIVAVQRVRDDGFGIGVGSVVRGVIDEFVDGDCVRDVVVCCDACV